MKLSDIISAVIAGAVFLLLLLGLNWNFLVAMVLSVGLYFTCSMILKPRKRIGGVDVENMQNGEQLEATFEDAENDLVSLKKSAETIRNHSASGTNYLYAEDMRAIARGTEDLVVTGKNIIHYLENHVDRIPQARRFLNYYLDTAVDILNKYTTLQSADIPSNEMRSVTQQTRSAVDTLHGAFGRQYSRLVSGEVMDIEVDVSVLKNMAANDQDVPFSDKDTVSKQDFSGTELSSSGKQ
ncbi:MAG: 5-bromo-4-chloroindolyl phosphate hydrolysis family protein [Bilifractor sp.]|jgi:5-bromo-4-chloroindolyl phosphate hydrolysis protein